jgi:hypothetical protein
VKIKPLSLKALPLAVLLCMASAAQADVVIYTDRAAFLAAITLPGTDTYNDLSGSLTPSPLSRMAGSYGYRASTGPVSVFYPAGSASDRWLATDAASDVITFSNFATGVRAFGGNFFASDINGAFSPGHTVVLTATDGTTTRTVNLENSTTASFLGFISTNPLSSVTLRPDGLPGSVYWATANNVTLGMVSAIPEPTTYGMLIAGLGLFGFMARRRAS